MVGPATPLEVLAYLLATGDPSQRALACDAEVKVDVDYIGRLIAVRWRLDRRFRILVGGALASSAHLTLVVAPVSPYTGGPLLYLPSAAAILLFVATLAFALPAPEVVCDVPGLRPANREVRTSQVAISALALAVMMAIEAVLLIRMNVIDDLLRVGLAAIALSQLVVWWTARNGYRDAMFGALMMTKRSVVLVAGADLAWGFVFAWMGELVLGLQIGLTAVGITIAAGSLAFDEDPDTMPASTSDTEPDPQFSA